MRNADPRMAEGPSSDDASTGVYSSADRDRARRRRQAVIAAVGLLSVLGIGGLVAQLASDGGDGTPAAQTGALEPLSSKPAGPLSVSGAPSRATRSAAAKAATSAPAATRTTARGTKPPTAGTATTRAGSQTRTTAPTAGAASVADDADVTSTAVQQGGETVTVKYARTDLTGYRELGWVQDAGQPVGNARCSRNLNVGTGAEGGPQPVMLVCWRVSARRSVYTVTIKADGAPSEKVSAAVIDRTWTKLDR